MFSLACSVALLIVAFYGGGGGDKLTLQKLLVWSHAHNMDSPPVPQRVSVGLKHDAGSLAFSSGSRSAAPAPLSASASGSAAPPVSSVSAHGSTPPVSSSAIGATALSPAASASITADGSSPPASGSASSSAAPPTPSDACGQAVVAGFAKLPRLVSDARLTLLSIGDQGLTALASKDSFLDKVAHPDGSVDLSSLKGASDMSTRARLYFGGCAVVQVRRRSSVLAWNVSSKVYDYFDTRFYAPPTQSSTDPNSIILRLAIDAANCSRRLHDVAPWKRADLRVSLQPMQTSVSRGELYVASIDQSLVDTMSFMRKTADGCNFSVPEWIIYGRIEHASHSWNAETGTTPLPLYQPILLGPIVLDVVEPTAMPSQSTALSRVFHFNHLRLCNPTYPGGVWIVMSRILTPIEVDKYGIIGPDAGNAYFYPQGCRFEYFNQSMAERCLTNSASNVVLVGDSNMRRFTKELYYHLIPSVNGSWCSWRRKDYPCLCEDLAENSLIWHNFNVGLTMVKYLWVPCMTIYHVYCQEVSASSTLLAHLTPLADKSVLLVFDTIHWDAAFHTFDSFRRSIDDFFGTITRTLRNSSSTVVFRAPNYYCCGADDSKWRQFTTGRIEMFFEYARRSFMDLVLPALPNSKILDVYSLSREKSPQVVQQTVMLCHSGHEPSEDVSLQNQFFLNQLCNAGGS